MYRTKNDLPESVRTKSIELLNARLADSIDLQTQCKQAHWNVNCVRLELLYRVIARAVRQDPTRMSSEFASTGLDRRTGRALGGVAEGTARMVAKRTTLSEHPAGLVDGRSHVDAMSSALAAFGKTARKAIDDSAGFGDADTADIFTEVSRGVDKWLWFVEAHLQAER